jgi:uncharacterized protein YaaW (UPF0174 family)
VTEWAAHLWEEVALDELRTALELATEDELQQLTKILFSRKFNPLDYVRTPDLVEIQSQDRQTWLDTIEDRFRFLAADGMTVLQGKTQGVSYRQTLVQVCRYLKIPYSNQLSTTDLESEVFLYLMGKNWHKLPSDDRASLTVRVQNSLANTKFDQPLPAHIQHDPIKLILKGSGAIAVSSVIKPLVLHQIARQFALHFASYQVARQTLIRGGIAATSQLQGYIALYMAKRGMAMTAAQQVAVRGVFAILGPAMWGWFFADLGWRSISTNYGRIIPTIVALAQIRLTRSTDWDAAYC